MLYILPLSLIWQWGHVDTVHNLGQLMCHNLAVNMPWACRVLTCTLRTFTTWWILSLPHVLKPLKSPVQLWWIVSTNHICQENITGKNKVRRPDSALSKLHSYRGEYLSEDYCSALTVQVLRAIIGLVGRPVGGGKWAHSCIENLFVAISTQQFNLHYARSVITSLLSLLPDK